MLNQSFARQLLYTAYVSQKYHSKSELCQTILVILNSILQMHLRNIMLNQSFRDNTFHTSYYRGISVNHTKSEICHTYRYFILKCRGISEISYRYYCKSELTLRSYSISGYKIACISWCSSLGTTDCCPRRLGGEISNYSGFLTSPPLLPSSSTPLIPFLPASLVNAPEAL
jgi:hypothetical protein